MHAIILAAGMGTRLGTRQPKPLTEIAPSSGSRPALTLLKNQIDAFSRLIGPQRILVVVGHEAMSIIEAHPHVMFTYNPRFDRTETGHSLLLGLRQLDDDVLWVNGDLYFEPASVERLLSTSPDSSRALVDPRASLGDEQVKYTLHSDGAIARLAKHARQASGESLGMHVLIRADRPALLSALERANEGEYFEQALERCTLDRSIRLTPVDIGGAYCREVDFPEDLADVRRHVAARAGARPTVAVTRSGPMRVGVFGTGHFGYAVLRHLEQRVDGGRPEEVIDLCAYDHNTVVRSSLARERRHPFDHAGSPLGPRVRIVDSVAELVSDLDVLILAVPSVSTREVAEALAAQPWRRPLVLVHTAKALDYQTGRRLSEIVADIIADPPQPLTHAVLCGGTIADELLRQNPLGVTIACAASGALSQLKGLFTAPNMWVQTSPDVVGVEVAGAFKNVISICAGMVRGLDLSYGAETHMISRMASEVEGFCVRCLGARRETFAIGSQCWGNDMWMSCTGPTRNRALGELLGQGKTLDEATGVMAAQHKTVEGVATLRALDSLLKEYPSELPLLRVADEIILRGAAPKRLIDALMEEQS